MQGEKREKTFTVSLKGLAPFVSAIRYEKSQKDVKLFITLAKETRPAVIVEDKSLGGKLSDKMFQNLEYHQASSWYISKLAPQDFKECGAQEADLRNCLADLKNSMLDFSFLLLAQSPSAPTPKGFLWTQQQGLKEKISQGFPSQTKENWVVVQAQGSLEQTQQTILSLLERV